MTALPDSVKTAVDSGRLAHFVTLNPDGSPQVTIVWAMVDGDQILTAHLAESQKVRNVRRDPRVVISIETGGQNAMGLDQYLVLQGTAVVEEGRAPELLQEMAYRYMGPGVKFPPMDNPPAGFTIRTTITRIGGVGDWT